MSQHWPVYNSSLRLCRVKLKRQAELQWQDRAEPTENKSLQGKAGVSARRPTQRTRPLRVTGRVIP